MSYFDEIFKSLGGRCRESSPQVPLDSCMVFNMAKGTRLVASRMRAGLTPPSALSKIMPDGELAYLMEYLNGYAERPVVVNTSLGWAVAIPLLYPSTSLCVLSVANVGGENFLRVAKNQRWDIALSPSAAKRQLRSTGIREGHAEESLLLWSLLCDCFAPFPTSDACSSPSELLSARALSVTEYVSRRARIKVEDSLLAFDELDLPLYLAFILLFVMGGYEERAEECAKVSVSDHSHGVEAVIVEKAGRNRARISAFLSEVCSRGNIPFEYFYEDGRVFARIVPIRRDWAYLGIKSPEKE